MRYLIPGSLILAAIIHLLPLIGALGNERLAALYGIDTSEPNLSILLRHRAVLFGLLGAFLLVAAFRPGWQAAAFVAALVSVVSFLLLAWSTGGYNALIGRVVTADLVALAALVGGGVAWWRSVS